MGSAHHSLREHPIMFAFGEAVQIPFCNLYKSKKKRHPFGCLPFLVAEVGFEPHDLRVMSPTSYQAALLRDIYLRPLLSA